MGLCWNRPTFFPLFPHSPELYTHTHTYTPLTLPPGKSTLMNLLAGDLTPTEGEQRRSHKLRVGRYAQHFVDALRMDETPVEYLLSRFPESGETARVGSGRGAMARGGLQGRGARGPVCASVHFQSGLSMPKLPCLGGCAAQGMLLTHVHCACPVPRAPAAEA